MTRATDLPNEARAFLDALAVGESGGKDDDAVYSILFGGSHFAVPPWPTDFPHWSGRAVGDSMTHAAGRYQFEPATWRGLGGGAFDPEHQDHMAWQLACEVYRGKSGNQLLDMLEADDLAGIADTLQSTWTSLSEETFASRYREAIAAITNAA